MMKELVLAQALLLTGQLEDKQQELLRVLCGAAASSLRLRLKEGLKPEDCSQDFIAAASLYAVAALGKSREEPLVEEFKAGDLTVRQSVQRQEDNLRALEKQADMLMAPYFADSFSFVGV